ncbi:MAG: DNA repair protein RadA [Holosporaceae bacterium]|nr:DNA repair protein RadA [Holosporaceae bacterium]
MSKSNDKSYHCSECGAKYPKWLGRCEDCGQWNSISEDIKIGGTSISGTKSIEFKTISSGPIEIERKFSGIDEFDRVLGGGMVPGSVILIGGDPGIGKSTLLLQVLSALSQDYECVYISGEESSEQIFLRAARLEVNDSDIQLACEINVDIMLKSMHGRSVDFLVVDSVQTLQTSSVESIPGTITQVRASTCELINFAKTTGATVFLVGHVTKDGAIAGPKTLEHMVDTVLYFEGERGNSYRILRCVKNRYGPCDELGIFEMQQQGLMSVSNPSVLFMTQRDYDVAGTTVFSGIEGTRPLLVEVQALVSRSYFTSPRRTVVGWDINRLFTILAVIESKCRISFSDKDVYLSIAGGLRISEPAGDLAVAVSLLSAKSNCVVNREICAFGEIGLTGEIRSVSRCTERIKEAEKLGFKSIILPFSSQLPKSPQVQLITVKTLPQVAAILGLDGTKRMP